MRLSEDEIEWQRLAHAFNALPFVTRKAESGELRVIWKSDRVHATFIVAGLNVPAHKKNHSVSVSSSSEARLWRKAYRIFKSLKQDCKNLKR